MCCRFLSAILIYYVIILLTVGNFPCEITVNHKHFQTIFIQAVMFIVSASIIKVSFGEYVFGLFSGSKVFQL